MIKILNIFLVLIIGIIFGTILAKHQGYVLIQIDDWNIETNVTTLISVIMLTILVFFIFECILRRILHITDSACNWLTNRKRRRANYYTYNALIKLAEGDYRTVEKLLLKDAKYAEQPIANYLLATEAAQQYGNKISANKHLEKATFLSKNYMIPIEITRVRLQLSHNKIHLAHSGINHLIKLVPYHPEVLRLAEQTYRLTQDWNSLLNILPLIKRTKIKNDIQCKKLQQDALLGIIEQKMIHHGSKELKYWWKNQENKIRQEPLFQIAVAKHLVQCNDPEAQKIILEALKYNYDDRLILLIKQIKNVDYEILEELRKQIKQHGTSSLLYSVLGQMLMRHGEWMQAVEAFQQSLEKRPNAFDYAYLAEIYDHLHRSDDAAKMRHKGLLLITTVNNETHIQTFASINPDTNQY